MISAAICQHIAVYWDTDEYRCRECARSLSFPPRQPTAEDEKDRRRYQLSAQGEGLRGVDRRRAAMSCWACRAKTTIPTKPGPAACEGCGQELVVVTADGDHQLPPFVAPRLLKCTCCHRALPQSSFNRNAGAKHRECRNALCRGCQAFRAKVRREEGGQELRDRQRQLAQEQRDRDKTAGILPTRTQAQVKANTAATRRYQQRQKGRLVLVQRRGSTPIHITPVCRVFMTCPLAPYCVDKVEAGRAALSAPQKTPRQH